ncbi:MAG TPA: hypothetical protein VFZ53_15650 [Polyangiaceae bacterium]
MTPRLAKTGIALSVLLAALGATPLALAAEEAAEEPGKSAEEAKADDDAFGHGGQLGLRVGLVAGYRMILRYEDSPLCAEFDPEKGTDQQKFCGHAAPFALNTALSYGVFDWLEPFAWGRFGLAAEDETYTKPVLMFGAGVRIYTMSDSPFKIFIEPAIGLGFEDGEDVNGDTVEFDTDVAFHLAAGPTLDFSRNFGAYVTGGVTTTIIRALATSLEAELGIQGRY